MVFRDRVAAGTLLSRKLSSYRGTQSIVLGLPRGGVVVAAEIAKNLDLPLDVLVVKKIGAPNNPELAIGAVAPDGVFYGDEKQSKTQIAKLSDQVKQKTAFYRKNRGSLNVKGKTVLVADDGAATGATIRAAIRWLKKKKTGQIVVALPVAPAELAGKLEADADDVVVLETPEDFSAVGQFYDNFEQVTDEDMVELLRRTDNG